MEVTVADVDPSIMPPDTVIALPPPSVFLTEKNALEAGDGSVMVIALLAAFAKM
jgi:hypothetical protein